MTDKKSRKVLIINNIKSDTIDQAIFILKGDTPSKSVSLDKNIAGEAQEIIDRYIRQVERLKGDRSGNGSIKTTKAPRSLPWPLLFFVSSLLSVVLSIALIYYTG